MWKNFYENTLRKYEVKYREIFWYLVCGAGTTVVNLVSFWCCDNVWKRSTFVSTCIAWLLSVCFAYLTNRTFVFHSKNNAWNEILREITTFLGARICSGILEVLLMVVLVDGLHFPKIWMKMGVSILVTICNYIAGKWIIFSGKQSLRKEKTYAAEN